MKTVQEFVAFKVPDDANEKAWNIAMKKYAATGDQHAMDVLNTVARLKKLALSGDPTGQLS